MNVRTLCLAILNAGDSTGYEIRKLSTDGHFSHFVDASYGSIYPALNKLEQDGMVTCREEVQAGKPARKVYAITDAGRAEFMTALTKPIQRDIFKSEFLLVAMFAGLMQRAEVSRAIDTQINNLENDLSVIEGAIKSTEFEGACWVANYGKKCISASLEHLKSNRAELEAIAGTLINGGDVPVAAE